ncbi:MAG: lipoyl(octanoyl) transferase LipB [Candidatus Methylomirabilales bacterium]
MRECDAYWLGCVEYGDALTLQRDLASARMRGDVDDCLLLLEHPPVITLGRGAKRKHLLREEDVLKARGIELWESERGGDVTFHGPGQLVGYPIVDLTQHGKDLHVYMRNLEEMLIRTLRTYGVRGERSVGQAGIWTHGAKIASVGVHVSRWVSRHGFALNVSTDLSFFDLIIPCGLSDVRMTSMAAVLGREVAVKEVAEVATREFGLIFECTPRWRSHWGAAVSLQ